VVFDPEGLCDRRLSTKPFLSHLRVVKSMEKIELKSSRFEGKENRTHTNEMRRPGTLPASPVSTNLGFDSPVGSGNERVAKAIGYLREIKYARCISLEADGAEIVAWFCEYIYVFGWRPPFVIRARLKDGGLISAEFEIKGERTSAKFTASPGEDEGVSYVQAARRKMKEIARRTCGDIAVRTVLLMLAGGDCINRDVARKIACMSISVY
jgi:hypothetical protein